MRVHFLRQYVRDTVIIFEEGNILHQKCPQCDMLMPWHALNRGHLATSLCSKGTERNQMRLEDRDAGTLFTPVCPGYRYGFFRRETSSTQSAPNAT